MQRFIEEKKKQLLVSLFLKKAFEQSYFSSLALSFCFVLYIIFLIYIVQPVIDNPAYLIKLFLF